MTNIGVQVPEVMLPAVGVDLAKWAVVACDQYSSQPAYWKEVERLVGEAPSTLNLIFPEVYLGQDDAARIVTIQASMRDYLQRQLLVSRRGMIALRRTTPGPHGLNTRSGLMAAIDLESYDYSKGAQSLTRATEGTILDRLPPRIRIREGAPLELPHVMLLIDDPTRSVIEPILAKSAQGLETLYDVELMQGGGHLRGYAVDAEAEAKALAALAELTTPEIFSQKYNLPRDTPPLLFAVGDGNHSLATAKAVWERTKQAHNVSVDTHPARFALVEIVNVHDEGLAFEPIHRVLFGLKQDLFAFLQGALPNEVQFKPCSQEEAFAQASEAPNGSATQRVAFVSEKGAGVIEFMRPKQSLPVATSQALLDAFMAQGGAHSIDYVHGTDAVCELGQQAGNLGLYLPAMSKGDFFKTVILDGALPRKTFSMGEAYEKRFYLECRRILP